jgi:hypothetical protein
MLAEREMTVTELADELRAPSGRIRRGLPQTSNTCSTTCAART